MLYTAEDIKNVKVEMSLRFISTLTPAACGGEKQCGEAPHHLTPPCQQSRLCTEVHRGIVGKPAGVRRNKILWSENNYEK